MASIQKRTSPSGEVSYRVQVRLKGHPEARATFKRLTDAKMWAQSTEAAMRERRYFKTSVAQKHIRALPFLFMFLTFPAICAAQKPERQSPERPADIEVAQNIIDACWSISEDNRASGNTPRMRTGALDSARCMEDAILSLVSRYLNKNDPDALEQYREDMDKLRAGYGHMMWNLYNYHDGCNGGCGTMYYTFHNLAYAHLLEDILKKAVKQIQDYDLQDDLFGAGVLIGKKSDAVNIPPEKPSSICLGESCGTFSMREVHGVYAVESLYYTLDKTGEAEFSISIEGFITQASKDAFTVHGYLYSDYPQDEEDVCTFSGNIPFKLTDDKTWVLDAQGISCLAGQGKITLRP